MNKKIGSIPQLYIRHCYALPSDYAYVAPVVIKKEKTMSKKCGCFPVCLHEKDIYRFQMSPEERTEILELIESYIDHLKDDPSFITEFLYWAEDHIWEKELTEAEVLAAMYPHLNQGE